jgi:RNA polymerase sigma-70 factor (ECF subfamily)
LIKAVVATPLGEDESPFDIGFGSLYRTEAPVVLRYLQASVGSFAQAEDLCAETFLRAWKAWPKFSGEPDEGRPWLLRIARNLLIDADRRARLIRFFPLRYEDSSKDDATASVAVDRLQLERALRLMPKADRDLLALRAAGLSHAEIALVQGRSEHAVKMAWHRALERLRPHMEDTR